MPRSSSVLPGSTSTSAAAVAPTSARAIAVLPERLAGERGGRDEEQAQGDGVGQLRAAQRPGRDRVVPVVRRRCSRASPITAVLQEAQPARPGRRVLLDRGQEAGVQLGMLRLDPPGDPARVAGRPTRDDGPRQARHRRPGPRTWPGATPRPSPRIPAATRPGRAPARRAPTPASRAPGRSRAGPAGTGARPVPVPAAVRCSCRQSPPQSAAGAPGIAPPARFRRSGRRWPPGSASARASGDFPAPRSASAGAARGRPLRGTRFASRQPNCSRVSTCSGAVLLSSGSRFTANDRAPSRGVDRVDARAGRSRRRRGAPAATVDDRPVRLVDDQALGRRRPRPAAARDRGPGGSPRRAAAGSRPPARPP